MVALRKRQTLDQSAPLSPLLGDVSWGDDLHGQARRALRPGLLTQGLCDTNDVHATVVAVLLRWAGLLHEQRLPAGAQERLQFAGDAPRVQRVAAVLRVIVGKVI